jgi:hypothetical protein
MKHPSDSLTEGLESVRLVSIVNSFGYAGDSSRHLEPVDSFDARL